MAGAIPVQTQEDLVPPAPAALGYRWAGVVLAPSVAVTLHLVLAGPLGLELPVPEAFGSSTLAPLPILSTALFSLVMGLLGWATVAGLEKGLGGPRGRQVWVLVAIGVTLASLGTFAGLDIPLADKWGLSVLHLAVGAVLIPCMANGTAAEPLHREP